MSLFVKNRMFSRFALIVLSMLCVTALVAQNVDVEKAPKIGLVLSGGGAKGMAHIGALKVIEEAGIEIDYIGGSRMGGI